MNIERVKIASLVGDPSNVRKHDQKNLDAIKGSLARFGQQKPIVVGANNVVIAGNGTVAAALSLGWVEISIVRSELIGPEATAFAIADNRTAELAEWDENALAQQLAAIQINDEDLARATGFDAREIERLSKGGEVVEDEVPEPPADPITKPGDLWILGEHRLLCGDSTKADDVERLMAGAKADLCLTDPPYGLGDTTSEKNNYNEYDDSRINLIKTISGFFPLAKSVAKCVVFTPGNGNTSLYESPTWTMAWFTPAGVGRGPWGFCCWQPILCYGKDPKLAKGKGCHPDALTHTEASEKLGHPCTKPIKLWCWLMERTSEKGETIYEPFGGSGTTLIAAEQLGRKCYGMEISPQYCDVIVKRWETLTQRKAVRYPAAS
jgi:hypothetical protein